MLIKQSKPNFLSGFQPEVDYWAIIYPERCLGLCCLSLSGFLVIIVAHSFKGLMIKFYLYF